MHANKKGQKRTWTRKEIVQKFHYTNIIHSKLWLINYHHKNEFGLSAEVSQSQRDNLDACS